MGRPQHNAAESVRPVQVVPVGYGTEETEAGQVKTDTLDTREPFTTLFPINRVTLEAIVKDMKGRGFDPASPIVTWDGIVIDGHTRLEAARMNGIADVPTVGKEFADEDEAIAYAIHAQRARRNLTDSDIVRLVGELDKRRVRGGDHMSEKAKASHEAFAPAGKSAETTAELIGTSRQKVEKARAVLDKAAPEVKAAVASGDMTINKAYQETRTKASGKVKTPEQEEAFYAKRAKEEESEKQKRPGVGVRLSNDAIAILQKIPIGDPLRQIGLQTVAQWIKTNK